ncbi:hypothetical protein, partial [Rhodanobacter sp. 115]|uniref:hypothetical protein n=1 Tax=Rhodanobacter sp. FW021-MT20 TaxID=1162282 RepID=UPI001ED914DF
ELHRSGRPGLYANRQALSFPSATTDEAALDGRFVQPQASRLTPPEKPQPMRHDIVQRFRVVRASPDKPHQSDRLAISFLRDST